MFSVVANDNDVMPPFIFPHGLRINTETYIKFLVEVLLPWLERVAAGRLYIWEQDSTHATQTKEGSIGCEEISATISPLTSGNQFPNSFGYYDSGTVKGETSKNLCNTKDELKARITAEFINLNKIIIKKAYRRFQSHLKAVVEANNFFV